MKLPILVAAACLVATLARAQSGPALSWKYPLSLMPGVGWFEVCVNDVCTTSTPTRQDEGEVAKLTHQFATPFSPQGYRFKVKACNAIMCLSSDDLPVSVPAKPFDLELR